MRKSNFGSSGNQRHSVLKPRNSDITPNSRQSSGQQLRKLRGSTDGMKRLSQIYARYTPTRSNIPRYTPVRSNVPSSSALLQPSSASRLSVDSTRSSSIGGKNRKETRPVGDAAFKRECIDKILDFLTASGSDSHVTRKSLNNPVTKEFVNIFNFIYGHLEEHNYALPSKFEEEIPRLLKTLKYPSQMSKSSFVPVGSRHTWPSVLAMLAWLIDIISIFNSPDVFSLVYPTNFDIDSAMKQNRISKLLEMFLSLRGQENLEEHFIDYRHTSVMIYEVRPQDLYELQECEDKLEEEIAELSKEPEGLKQLMYHHEQLVNDREKMISYNKELNIHISAKDSERAQLILQLDDVVAELQKMNEEQAHHEEEKEKQGFSVEQITKFKNYARELSSEITQLQAKGKDHDSQTWTLQMNLGKAQKELQDVSTYNEGISQLDYAEGLDIACGNISEVIHQWKKTVWDLSEFKKEAKQAMYEAQKQKIRKQEALALGQDALKDRKYQSEKRETKLRRVEEDISLTSNEIQREEREMEADMEHLHQVILEARKEHKTPLHQLQNALEEAKNDLEVTVSTGKARMRSGAEFQLKVCHKALEDLDMRTKLAVKFNKDVKEYCDGLLESVTQSRAAAQKVLRELR